MIELKKEFTKKGIEYKQIYKDNALVLYQISRNYTEYGITTHNYEIFKYFVRTPDKYHNEEYELYPGDEAFGKWAWYCSDKKSLNKVLKKHFPSHILSEKCFSCPGV